MTKPGPSRFNDLAHRVVAAFKHLRKSLLPHAEADEKLDDATALTLLRCMALVADADGVSQEELETIASIYHKLTGRVVGTGHVLDVVGNISVAGADPVPFVAAACWHVPESSRITIGRACFLVMTADGEISNDENVLFDRLLEGLRVRRIDVVDMPQYPPI